MPSTPTQPTFYIAAISTKSARQDLLHFLEIKDRFTCTQCLGAFSRWAVAPKARALDAAGNASDPARKNP